MKTLLFLVLMMINIDIFAHIVINDQAVQKIPIIENHEPMVDLRQYDFIHIGPSPEVANNQDYYWVRQSVADKLKIASQNLPKGYQLCLYEGHRSLALQSYLFQSYHAKIKQRYPDLGKKELFKKTTQLISPITNYDNTPNIPPHSTGAAIDVYLLNDKGELIDMGIHPKDWQQDITGEISITQSQHISKEAQTNRNIMSKALESAGFVNYPFEYWHWSYGDKYWAYIKQKPHAIYNVIKN
jgi:zinc D-Ala-D-Ala dipeptidase